MISFIEKFKPFFVNIGYYSEYIPVFLIFIYFSLQDELHLNIFTLSVKTTITVFVLIFFFFLILHFPKYKLTILLISTLLWMIFIFSKNKMLNMFNN
jgi:hypothetical protein